MQPLFEYPDHGFNGIDRGYARAESIWNCECLPAKARRSPGRVMIRTRLMVSACLRCLADILERGIDGHRTDLPGAV